MVIKPRRSNPGLFGATVTTILLVSLLVGCQNETPPDASPAAPAVTAPVAAAAPASGNVASGNVEARPARSIVPVTFLNLSGITWDGEGLWLTIDGEGKSHRVDPVTGEVQKSLDLPIKETGGSAYDGTSLWQLAYLEHKIYRLDPNTGEVQGTIPAPGKGMCSGMTFDGEHLWLAGFEDGKLYKIDPKDGTLVESLEGDFETTGLAWDGRYLWNGVLVGTKEHDEETPYTGFVQQRDHVQGVTLQALPVNGVFAGGTNWLPGGPPATKMWWYDGFNEKLVQFSWDGEV